MPNLTGQSVGRYHILEQLGEGGMATVYKAYDTRLERNVALKVLRTDQFIPAQLHMVLQRFEREAKSLAKLKHPNIVNILDFGEYENSPYLVMEYLPGGTLKQKLGQAIPWQETFELLLPVARGLAYAHEHGIIHRDVKPANILLDENGTPTLTDFGIAKLLEGTDGRTLTGSGVGIGTPEYMAPEQGIGASTIDARADIYSLGIVLYEMVTGRKPYIADTPMAIILKQMTDPLPRPTNFVPNILEGVEHILFKALAKEPEDRYEDMYALIATMDGLLAGTPTAEAQVIQNHLKRGKKEATPFAEPSDKVDMALANPRAMGAEQRWYKNPRLWGVISLVAVLILGLLTIPRIGGYFVGQAPVITTNQTAIAPVAPTIPTHAQTIEIPILTAMQVNQSLWEESPHANAEDHAFTRWDQETPLEVPVACAECHSQTGFIDYLGADGSPVEVVDSPVPIGEVLECETCHLNKTRYEVRTIQSVLFPSGARLSFATRDPNNLCIACHGGRRSKNELDSRTGAVDPDTPSDTLSIYIPHHNLAGATLFGMDAGGAYEYDGRLYDRRYTHAEDFNTCTGCHNPHSTALHLDACATCHTGSFNSSADLRQVRYSPGNDLDYDSDGNTQEGLYGEIETLNQILLRAIQSYSRQRIGIAIGYYDSYPHWYIDTNGDGVIQDEEAISENQMSPWTPRLMRAVYNYQWSIEDPGAYAHNPHYMIQILYDTLKDLGADVSALSRP